MLTNDEVIAISRYLNYSFSHRDHLTEILSSRSTKNGENWDTEVSGLLAAIAVAKASYESSLSDGGIKRTKIDGELEIEYTEGNSRLQGLKAMYYNLLGKLFKLIELSPLPNSNYKVR